MLTKDQYDSALLMMRELGDVEQSDFFPKDAIPYRYAKVQRKFNRPLDNHASLLEALSGMADLAIIINGYMSMIVLDNYIMIQVQISRTLIEHEESLELDYGTTTGSVPSNVEAAYEMIDTTNKKEPNS